MQTEGLLENNSIYIAGKVTEECVFSHEVYGRSEEHTSELQSQ